MNMKKIIEVLILIGGLMMIIACANPTNNFDDFVSPTVTTNTPTAPTEDETSDETTENDTNESNPEDEQNSDEEENDDETTENDTNESNPEDESSNNIPNWIANKIENSDFIKKSNKVYELNGCYQMNYVRCGNINYCIHNINVYDNNNLTHHYTLNDAKNHNILLFDNNRNHKITLDFSRESISFTNNSQVYLEKVSDTIVNIIVVL